MDENAILGSNKKEYNEDSFDFDDLEQKLQSQLDLELSQLNFLESEKEKIGNPDNLGEIIKDVIWEQFMNQIAVRAGEDFVKENNDMYLDLRDEAHIQTTENFEKGEIATHNHKINYQERYDETYKDFKTNPKDKVEMSKNMRYNEESGEYERFDQKSQKWVGKKRYNNDTKIWEEWSPRSESWKKMLDSEARKNFDTRTKDQKGSKTIVKDHTISVAEQIRDMDAAAHIDRSKRKDFAKSDANLNDLDTSANASKSDLTMTEWLDKPRADGKSQAEFFGLDEEKLRKKDKVARDEYEKMKAEGKKKSYEVGKQSQKEEAFRVTGKALRAVVMRLLAEFVKDIIAKLVKWLKSEKKNLESLLSYIKEAISSFVGNMKTHLINAGNTLVTTIITSIVGPIVGTIKKVWILLKQGWKSLKEAVNYIKNPENKGKPIGRLLLETGKIVIAGLSGMGSIVLGEVIEDALMAIPMFAIQIPMLGSMANILGIFMGAVVSGIVGAIAINLIDKTIAKQRKADMLEAKVDKANEVLVLQHEIRDLNEQKLANKKDFVASTIKERHEEAANCIKQSLDNIFDDTENYDHQDEFDELNDLLSEIFD